MPFYQLHRRELLSLLGGVAAAWSVAAHAQGSPTIRGTNATTVILPRIEMARVKSVDKMPPNPRLSDDLIDLRKDFSLSSAQGIGSAWETPPHIAPADAFDERYGRWCSRVVPGPNRLPWYKHGPTFSPCSPMR
jgi:hypothetical protein